MLRFPSFVRLALLALFVLLLPVATPRALSAQGGGDGTTAPAPGDPVLADARPAQMAYQPPADAQQLEDFLPPGARLTDAAPSAASEEALASEHPLALNQTTKAAVSYQEDSGIRFQNDVLGIVVEKETFSQPVDLTFTPTWVTDERQPAPIDVMALPAEGTAPIYQDEAAFLRFQLEAVQAADGQSVTQFSKPVRLVLDLRSFGYDLNQEGGKFFLAYENEAKPGEWIEVPVTTHQAEGLISAEVTHFSDWTTGWRPEAWAPQWRLPTVSEFSGAAAFQYPFEVPPGRHGLQPTLGLSYSSSALNGAIRSVSLGRIATGWSMNEISIVRTGVKFQSHYLLYPDTFRLVLNGAGFELTQEVGATGNVQRFYAKDMPSLRIYSYNGRNYDNNNGGYWVVETGDGTHYRLGYTANTRTIQKEQLNNDTPQIEVMAWHIDTVTDRHGNQMTYQYTNGFDTGSTHYEDTGFWCPWGGGCVHKVWTYDSLLQNIRYNYPDRITAVDTGPVPSTVPQLTTTPATIISFAYDSESYLKTVTVQHGGATLRQYGIAASTMSIQNPGCLQGPPAGKHGTQQRTTRTRIINSITPYGFMTDPEELQPVAVALPAVQFSYQDKTHYYEPGYGDCFIYKYLSEVNNGYGGKTQFTYSHDGRVVNSYNYVAEYEIYYPQIGHNVFVTRVTNDDGRGHIATIDYAYNGRCYNQTAGDIGPKCLGEQTGAPEYGNIGGHSQVSVTINDLNGTPFQRRTTDYNTASKHLFGKTVGQQTGTPNLGNPFVMALVMQKSETAYTTQVFANGSDGDTTNDVTFTFTHESKSWQYDNGIGSTAISSKVRYAYDPAYQGGQQYGNLTHTRWYASADAPEPPPYRSAVSTYYPNATNGGVWLVGLAAYQATYAGEPGQNLLLETFSYYDNEASHTQPPTQGELRLAKTGITGDTTIGGSTNGLITTSRATYDDFGNVIMTTTPSRAQTTIGYDQDYRLYPVWAMVAEEPGAPDIANQVTYFDVYGFKGADNALVPLDGFQTQTGLLKAVRAVADATNPLQQIQTVYEYDPFGRLWATYGPGDNRGDLANPNDGTPMNRYRYWDNLWNGGSTYWLTNGDPFVITAQVRPNVYTNPQQDPNSPGYELKSQTYYDGFGRVIQEQAPWASVDGESSRRDLIVSTEYNVLGQVKCVTAPFDVALYHERAGWPNTGYVSGACASLPHTTTTYDALSRVKTVTMPDGAVADNTYSVVNYLTVNSDSILSKTQARDANGHIINNFTNSRGQLVMVRNALGNVDGQYTAYVDVHYKYNAAGNLTEVIKRLPQNNGQGSPLMRTLMTYDALGRKISMDDPDMGLWSYVYDASGNMVRQEANTNDLYGHAQCFYYDVLNRLQRKVGYTTQPWPGANPACPASLAEAPASGTNHLASYSYDTAAWGLGQPAQVSWGSNPAQNFEQAFYDDHGRAVKQTRWLDGREYSMETLGFDSLQRPTQVKYPNNDVTTIGYDREGENSLTLANGQTLVSNVLYNERGQLTQLLRGNGANTTMSYANETGNFRLQQLTHQLAGNNLYTFQYQYDPVGNILGIRDIQPTKTEANAFVNDDLNRLVAAAYGERTLSDPFTNTNNWQAIPQSPTWVVENGAYRHTDANCQGCGTQLIAGDATNVQNFVARFRFRYLSASQPWSILNFEFRSDTGGQNTVAVGIRPTNSGGYGSGVWVRQNGVLTQIATNATTVPLNTWQNLQVEATGSTVRLYLNDALLVETTVSRNVAGSFRLVSYYSNVEVDDLKIHKFNTGMLDTFANGSNWQPTIYGQNWTVSGGEYRHVGHACSTNPSVTQCDTKLTRSGFTNLSNFTARYRFRYTSTGQPWGILDLEFLNDQAGNSYLVGIRPTNGGGYGSGLWVKQSGAFQAVNVVNQTVPMGAWQELYVQVIDNYVRLYLNDTLLVENAIANPGSGDIRLMAIWSDVRVDDFEAYPISGTFTDTFTNGNNWAPDVEPTWAASGSGSYRQPDNDCPRCSTRLIAGGTTNLADFMATFRFKYHSTTVDHAALNLEFRSDSTNQNAVAVTIRPNNTGGKPSSVVLRQNGQYLSPPVAQSPVTVPLNSWHEFKVQVIDGHVQLFLNGKLLLTAVVNHLTAGNIFLTAVQADVEVDDFELYALDGGSTTQLAYQYDVLDNLKQRTLNGVATNYTYPTPGLTAVRPHGVTALSGGSTGTFGYDAHGNMTARTFDGSYTQAFDVENRLTSVVKAGSTTQFFYDAAGQRVKTVQPDGTITYYPFPGYEEDVKGSDTGQRTTYSLAGQAVAVRQTGLVAKDDFNDGNADGWTAHSGSWSVSGGAYRQTSTTHTATNSSYPLPQSGAMTFEWQATFNSGSRAAGMHIFASEAGSTEHGSSYLVWQDATYVRIYETINNIRTQRAIVSLAASNGQTYSYKATYDPATGVVTLWRDGLQRLSWTDSSPLSAGAYLALRTSSSSVNFDNVRVTAQSGVVTYLHSDHLGSASALSGANGSLVPGSVARYLPFGDWRTEPTTNPALTDMGFTGHKHNNSGANDLGLIYMNARFYVPGLGRFASADTIVPDPNNPQSFNRYSYVYNNPLKMIDPSGHCGADVGQTLEESVELHDQCVEVRDGLEGSYQVSITGAWTLGEMNILALALQDLFGGVYTSLYDVYNGVQINRSRIDHSIYRAMVDPVNPDSIVVFNGTFSKNNESARFTLLHEMGHVWDLYYDSYLTEYHTEYTGAKGSCSVDAFLIDACPRYRPASGRFSPYATYAHEDAAESWAAVFFGGDWDALINLEVYFDPHTNPKSANRLTAVYSALGFQEFVYKANAGFYSPNLPCQSAICSLGPPAHDPFK